MPDIQAEAHMVEDIKLELDIPQTTIAVGIHTHINGDAGNDYFH